MEERRVLAERTFEARVAERLRLGAAVPARLRADLPLPAQVLALGGWDAAGWAALRDDGARLVRLSPAGGARWQVDGPPAAGAIVASLAALPLADEAFDGVGAVQALAAVADPAPVLRELARVVLRGGALVVGEVDWASLAWEHPNRPLTELIRQAALRRVAPRPFHTRELVAQLHRAGWESIQVQPLPLVETGRGAVLLALAEQAANWAINSARCTPPAANGWLTDLRAAADDRALLATVTAYVFTAERAGD